MSKEDATTRIGRAVFAAIQDRRKCEPDFRLTEETLICALRPAVAKEMPKKLNKTERNALFDALAGACGYPKNITSSAARTVAAALKDILEVEPGLTPDALGSTAKAVLRKYEKAGPMAVAAHWHEFSVNRTERTNIAKRDVYQKPDEKWREVAAHKYPDAKEWNNPHDFSSMNWFDVSLSIRHDILQALR